MTSFRKSLPVTFSCSFCGIGDIALLTRSTGGQCADRVECGREFHAAASHFRQGRGPDSPSEMSGLPPYGRHGSDVFGDVRRDAPMGSGDEAARGDAHDASMASRQDGRDSAFPE